jgi:hypothetical protein
MKKYMGVITLLASASTGMACSCYETWDEWGVQKTVEFTDWVFIGKAVTEPLPVEEGMPFYTPGSGDVFQEVEVIQAGKGLAEGSRITLRGPGHSCGRTIDTANSWLLMIHLENEIGYMSSCDGSRPITEDASSATFAEFVVNVANGTASIGGPNRKMGVMESLEKERLKLAPGCQSGRISLDGKFPHLILRR